MHRNIFSEKSGIFLPQKRNNEKHKKSQEIIITLTRGNSSHQLGQGMALQKGEEEDPKPQPGDPGTFQASEH